MPRLKRYTPLIKRAGTHAGRRYNSAHSAKPSQRSHRQTPTGGVRRPRYNYTRLPLPPPAGNLTPAHTPVQNKSIHKYYYTGVYGIPATTLREWAAGTPSPAPPPAPVYERKLKVPLPILEDYSVPPSAEFWDSFPFRPIPAEPSTCINVDRFEQAIADISDLMTS